MLRLIDSHMGEDHVTSDDSRQFNSRIFGSMRAVISGMACTLTGNNTLTVSDGYAFIDGARVRVQGADSVEIPQGTIGKRRQDLLCLVYERSAEGVESLGWEYLTGAVGTKPTDPTLPASGSILANDAQVYIPFARVTLTGLTVGSPTRLLGQWVWPPSNASMGDTLSAINAACSRANAAAAQAQEAARYAREAYNAVSGLKAEHAVILDRLDTLERRTDQVGAVAAALLGSWFFSHGALYAPVGWVTVTDGAAEFRAGTVADGALTLSAGTDAAATTASTGLYTTNAIKGLFRDAVSVADPQ